MNATCEFCGQGFVAHKVGRPAMFCPPCRESRIPYRWAEFVQSLYRWQSLSDAPVREVRATMFRTANEVRAVEQKRAAKS